MRIGIILALFMLVPCEARSSEVDKVAIIEAGIYSARTVRNVARPHDPKATYTVDRIELLESTTTVPARRGIRFGFRYVILGSPKGKNVELGLAINFPKPGFHAPGSDTTYLRSEVTAVRPVGKMAYREFQFDHDWEMIPGLWTFEFWHGDRKVGEQSFCVVKELQEKDAGWVAVPKCPGTPTS